MPDLYFRLDFKDDRNFREYRVFRDLWPDFRNVRSDFKD